MLEEIFICHTIRNSRLLFYFLFISVKELTVFPTVCTVADQVESFMSFLNGSSVVRLEGEQNSLHARLAFCSYYDICVSVIASYNQWQENTVYMWKDHMQDNKKSMFKVHLILVFSMYVQISGVSKYQSIF